MQYIDRYEEYLNTAEKKFGSQKRQSGIPMLGYTSNLDIVLHWDAEKFDVLLNQYLSSQPDKGSEESISSIEDFFRISAYYMMHGLGGNFDLSSMDICIFLRKHFQASLGVGGTAAQAAAALARIGCSSLLHMTDESRELCRLLGGRRILTLKEGKKAGVEEPDTGEAPIYHFILQFRRGDKIHVLGREYIIPASNRLIFFYDRLHKKFLPKREFLEYLEREAEEISSYLVSGFDAICDPGFAKEAAKLLQAHLRRFKEVFPKIPVYFEGAFYMNPGVKEIMIKSLAPYIDIMGMNEEELRADLKREAEAKSFREMREAIEDYMRIFNIRSLVLHTAEYSLYYGKEWKEFNIEEGLCMGNLLAAARAGYGEYAGWEECRSMLRRGFSPKALRFAAEADAYRGEKSLYLIPSTYIEAPSCTIGLGDSFTAGMQICFIR
ncbi:MAG: ADP-dependent glucokinase/phosphofructokinase [Johnsonella sp.]|nr:ADP-dependent glucokinase/phosphofructokinase [Johnsonella sp.]